MNHPTEEQLVLYHYGETPDRQEFADHLECCGVCRADYEAMRRTLDLAGMISMPERDENYGTEVWRRLQPRLARTKAPSALLWLRQAASLVGGATGFHRWGLAGGLAAALCAAFFAGRYWSRPSMTPSPLAARSFEPIPPRGRERVLLAEIGDHLERSQVALIELINSKTNGMVDISLERAMARELVEVNRLYRQTAVAQGASGMASVLEDLERALIEISNSPAKLSPVEFAEFRQRIDTDGMLFKVQVVGTTLRAEERDAARGLGVKSIGL